MTKSLTLIAAMLATAACQRPPPVDNNADVTIPAITELPVGSTPTVPADRPLPVPAPPADSTTSVPRSVPTIADSDRSPAAANKVVEAYFAALSERRYADAYRLYPASGMSAAEFAASYAKYRTFHAAVGAPGNSEGGAGSIYIEIPIVVTGTLRSGGPFRLEGPVSLRRVNEVDGATEAQLHWHIFASGLKPRP